ncbi:DUF5819 family protein [Microbacterium natoriense]|uniref:DUF5819 family protein n=1 Tax=Microbacterium natoriense TaxID=284570 RepID=UPI0027D92EDC|nr:DUF5819 family protein [Microbacterium natoriense]
MSTIAAITVWHLFASFLWISPPTPLRQIVPGNMLSAYMLPWFGQSWSVFAPEPINGAYTFAVRAKVLNEVGEVEETDWVTPTDVEYGLAHHNLFPPRAANLGYHASSGVKDRWSRLTAEQQEITSLNYFEGDAWLGRLRDDLLAQSADNEDAVIDYIVAEQVAAGYATQVAVAVWGDEVVQVQFKATRQNIVPFAQRNDEDAKRPAPQIASTGWRGLLIRDQQDSAPFDEIFAGERQKEASK